MIDTFCSEEIAGSGMNSVFSEQILADKLSKLNSTQQCIESMHLHLALGCVNLILVAIFHANVGLRLLRTSF